MPISVMINIFIFIYNCKYILYIQLHILKIFLKIIKVSLDMYRYIWYTSSIEKKEN